MYTTFMYNISENFSYRELFNLQLTTWTIPAKPLSIYCLTQYKTVAQTLSEHLSDS